MASFASQDWRGIVSGGAPQRQSAAQQSDQRGQNQNDEQHKKLRLGSKAENSLAEQACKNNAQGITDSAANERKKQLLRRQKHGNKAGARSQRLHQPNFGAPFNYGGRRGSAHGQCRSQQRGKGHQP